jgi:hypothetical protein
MRGQSVVTSGRRYVYFHPNYIHVSPNIEILSAFEYLHIEFYSLIFYKKQNQSRFSTPEPLVFDQAATQLSSQG